MAIGGRKIVCVSKRSEPFGPHVGPTLSQHLPITKSIIEKRTNDRHNQNYDAKQHYIAIQTNIKSTFTYCQIISTFTPALFI